MTDDWRHSTTSSELPEKWIGETIFDCETDEEVKKPETKKNRFLNKLMTYRQLP